MFRYLFRRSLPSSRKTKQLFTNLNKPNSIDKLGVAFCPSLFTQEYLLSFFPNLSQGLIGENLPNSPKNNRSLLDTIYNICLENKYHPNFEQRGARDSFGIDFGMFDVHQIDQLNHSHPLHFNGSSMLVKQVENLIDQSSYAFTDYNLYVYRNCLNPRCLHIDSTKARHLKAFIYITNSSIDDGTYSYIPASHNRTIYNGLQYSLNYMFGSDLGTSRNDGTLYSSDHAIKFQAHEGDLLISDQRGVHGDMPCTKPNGGKVVLVLNFKTDT